MILFCHCAGHLNRISKTSGVSYMAICVHEYNWFVFVMVLTHVVQCRHNTTGCPPPSRLNNKCLVSKLWQLFFDMLSMAGLRYYIDSTSNSFGAFVGVLQERTLARKT